jgi:2-dehydro-3-deoxy-D-arabinonate dehydratase
MNLCRFQMNQGPARIGLLANESVVLDLSATGITSLTELLENNDCAGTLTELSRSDLPRLNLSEVHLLAPIERQEVWAAGVTYLRSKKARMEESNFSATAYDRVYEAERPELFFKSLPEKVVPTADAVGIREDARWNVPEPELALVINSKGSLVGYTIGNDMSSRDIEGENLLYLPQAKIYNRSSALGPWITIGSSESEARLWKIQLRIERRGEQMFQGETSVGQIKRSFDDLVKFLFRCQLFPYGAVLLTGTGIVPPDTFSLQPDDLIQITISGIGTLKNSVVIV